MISRFFVENKSSKPNRFFLCFFSQDLTAEIADKSEEILLQRQRNVNLATFVGEKYLEMVLSMNWPHWHWPQLSKSLIYDNNEHD